ncbi:IST1 like [Quillaja saponaria]|uniref:IST1 like n=1 Tax=Quillaja saponaria TaxID=32244 RepID=A0AAD7M442_QUISA|nr:IST1 like [Quillaja saponaria]
MLDGLLGRGFFAKCKSLIKLTKSRIDVIRRKRNATQKFLKKDIADLLANGLDVNAYGRAAGLQAELTLSSCYDFVEQSCDFVLKHLSVMQKQRECPEECREAISSLMFAAARFSDLPELRDLRQIFQERYGNALEYYVNQEFVENLTSRPSTLEKKIQLMQQIAVEFSLEWDSKAFEQKMCRPSTLAQGHKTYDPNNVTDLKKLSHGKGRNIKGENFDVLSEKRLEIASDGHRSHNGKAAVVSKRDDHNLQSRPELSRNGYKPMNVCDETILKRDSHGNASQLRQELAVKNETRNGKESSVQKPFGFDGHRFHNGKEEVASKRDDYNLQSKPEPSRNRYKPVGGCDETTLKRDNHDNPFRGRQEDSVSNGIQDKDSNMLKSVGLYDSSQGKKVEYLEGVSKKHNIRENTTRQRDCQETVPCGKPDTTSNRAGLHVMGNMNESFSVSSHGVSYDNANSMRKVPEDETSRVKPYYNNALPPYVKPSSKLKDSIRKANSVASHPNSEGDGVSKDPLVHKGVDAATTSDKIQLSLDRDDRERHVIGHAKVSRHGLEEGLFNRSDSRGVPLPKPRSVRRKHSRSRSGHSDLGTVEDAEVVKRKSRSRRRDDSRRGLQILFDDELDQNDEEERIIDKLLIHYSKKPSMAEPGKVKRKSKSRHAHHIHAGESLETGNREGLDEESEIVPPPERSVSLPSEQSGASEVTKVFTRAASFQPDRSSAS